MCQLLNCNELNGYLTTLVPSKIGQALNIDQNYRESSTVFFRGKSFETECTIIIDLLWK